MVIIQIKMVKIVISHFVTVKIEKPKKGLKLCLSPQTLRERSTLLQTQVAPAARRVRACGAVWPLPDWAGNLAQSGNPAAWASDRKFSLFFVDCEAPSEQLFI